MALKSVTCTAPVNIATVKYWGKRDENLILPTNSSLSVTLHQNELCTTTTIAASTSFNKDRMWLNGVEQSVNTPRIQNVLKEMRKRYDNKNPKNGGASLSNLSLHICSENNFPTAAGLASSAAGYACLVYTLSKLYRIDGDISQVARQGSGSACRSVFGGYVAWNLGINSDGSDSLAEQIATHDHWADMKILILVVNTGKKHTGSTTGMQTSVKTSELLQERIKQVPTRMDNMKKAILSKDFQQFAELTMKDSNQMHAVCLDTYPPISYMTDVSRDIQRLCHFINDFYKQNKVGYTFDAGPNACLYLLEENVPLVYNLVQQFFPSDNTNFINGANIKHLELPKDLVESVTIPKNPGAIKYVIHTQPGPGPQTLEDPTKSLLNDSGLPKTLISQ